MRDIILASEDLAESHLTLREVGQLAGLIGPALAHRYAIFGVGEEMGASNFWHPHCWGMQLTDEAFDELDECLASIAARLGDLTRNGNRSAIQDHMRLRTMGADLVEVGERRGRRAASVINGWMGAR